VGHQKVDLAGQRENRLRSVGGGSPWCHAKLPADGHLALVTTASGIDFLETGWRALERDHGKPHNVFQSFNWVKNWVGAYADPGITPVVLTGHRNGRLVFVWPLMTVRIGPTRVLRWLSEPLAQYGDVLIDSSEDLAGWCTAVLELLSARRTADVLWLRHIRDDAAIKPYAIANFHDARLTEHAPFLALSAFADDAAYDNRYSSSQRKRRKKIRKALEDDFGPVSFEVLPPGEILDATIVQAVREKSQWVDDRGRHNSILGCTRLPKFLSAMARASAGARLVATCLKAGGQPVSWELGLRSGNTHFAFITSHVNSLTDYSAARLHMDQSQRLALAEGVAVFDLMVPNDEYKQSWSSAVTATNDFHMPLSKAGWAFGRLYLEALRPVLRAAYYRLPESALRALKPVIGH
jgi:CelD/BcsL family acetyltransferase involved in cellulose biosynthesis